MSTQASPEPIDPALGSASFGGDTETPLHHQMPAGLQAAAASGVPALVHPVWGQAASAATAPELAPDLASATGFQADVAYRVPLAQRLVEIVLAAAALLFTAPIQLLLAILVRRGTPGPALFHQTRVGANLKPFRFVKFRTLYADARQRFPELYAYKYDQEELNTMKFKIQNDPRVTPQGRWMRMTTVDELPNFWNVLTGDMALVGPRPEIPEMLRYYHGEMLLKFTVRPGVTGLAQVSGRGHLGFYDTVELDVEYVKRRSMWLDLKILYRTALAMVTRDGAF